MPSQLKIWSFPPIFNKSEREDLIKHFGAVEVNHVVYRGKENAVLAQFKNDVDCEYALHKLHQCEVLGRRLMATYSTGTPKNHRTSEQPHMQQKSINSEEPSEVEKKQKKIQQIISRLCAVGANFGIGHPIPTNLEYLYPPPSGSIIANIAQTLVAVPKFYTQVLHLMNKMNLPTPFGPLFDIPPACQEALRLLNNLEKDKFTSRDISTTESMTRLKQSSVGQEINEGSIVGTLRDTSESESELESDGETSSIQKEKASPVKRKNIFPHKRVNKRPKISQLQQTVIYSSRTSEPSSMKDVFETSENQGPKKLHLNLQTTTLPQKEKEAEGVILQEGGFGKIEATVLDDKNQDEECMEEWREKSKYISKEEILDNRVNKADWPVLPVFKNYSPGEPSTKLYIKNLAKTTTEEDLKHIYGRYIFWHNDEEAGLFSIRLMKEGRMKGQAFVTFPSEEQANEALGDTNGYILKDKPMVVVFGKVKKTEVTKD